MRIVIEAQRVVGIDQAERKAFVLPTKPLSHISKLLSCVVEIRIRHVVLIKWWTHETPHMEGPHVG